MNDKMVKALANNGGVIMINFGSTFLDAKSRKWSDTRSDEIEKNEAKFGKDSDEAKAFSETYRDRKPFPFADIDNVVEHIDYAVKLVGVDYVGLGSDYDGVGDSVTTRNEGCVDLSKSGAAASG